LGTRSREIFNKELMVYNSYSTVTDFSERDQPKITHYSTVTNLSERVKFDLPKQILEFTITGSSNQLNQYNYTKQKRILTEPVISSMKLVPV